MTLRRRSTGRRTTAALGFSCGVAIGLALFAGGMVGAAVDADAPGAELRDVLHAPPLLVDAGEAVELRYDVVCQADAFGKPCTPAGNVFVRRSGDAAYRKVPLAPEGDSVLAASVAVPAAGISYYAEIDDGAGHSMTVPAAGAVAPQRAWSVPSLISVSLGAHAFGSTRSRDARVVSAAWGDGPGALGLITGRELVRIGPSAFDVSASGEVVVLDQVNDRLASYSPGAPPRYVPIAFSGGEGDFALGADGTAYVLDHGVQPVVRSYSPSGALAATTAVGAGADMLRAGPAGALLHAYPGDHWLPVGGPGALLQPGQQAARARAGRLAGGGVEVVVHGSRTDALFALVRGTQVTRAWRVSSATSLGEIQLAEPFGDGIVVVLRVWTETKAEFVALVLTPSGLAGSFALAASQWAESAALGRFRLEGETLYQLRSTPAGAEIVTFALGGAR